MTKPLTASDRGLKPHWKVRIVLPGVILHTASWTEPTCLAEGYEPRAGWINDSAYGDIIGYVDWGKIDAITWRKAE